VDDVMSKVFLRNLRFFLILICAVKPSLGSAFAEAQPIRNFHMAEIKDESLSIEAIIREKDSLSWNKVSDTAANFYRGDTRNVVRFKLQQLEYDEIVIRVFYAHIQNTQAFAVDGDNARELKALPDRYAAFLVPREYIGKDIFVIQKFSGFSMFGPRPIFFMDRYAYQIDAEMDRMYIGIVFGIIFIMIVYNIGMFLLFRKVYLLLYILYCLSAAFQFSFTSGLTLRGSLEVGLFYYIASFSSGSFAVLFSMHVLNIKRESISLYRIGLFVLTISFISLIGSLLGHHFFVKYFVSLAFPVLGYSTFLAVRAAYNGYRPAYAMLLGWSGLWLSFVLVAMQFLISGFPNMGWGPPIAISFEIATFSFAMGQKLRMSELKFMKENQHAFAEMAKMVYSHQLSDIRLGKPLEETMPTTTSQACVLSFDIIGSSKIQHVNAKIFFRNTFTKCNEIISEGYDGKNLRANAYRIKEMGDGFLCSIGYPFQAMSNNLAHDAVDLAKRFAKVLHEEQKMLHTEIPTTCGIGIALDTITGFYPEAGTKEYDLYGQAIVLATRYEGMRKTLFEADKGRSVLIIQEKVFLSLDPSHRCGFASIDLKELGVVVRDDPAATKLYYQYLDQDSVGEERPGGHLKVV
jgi:class 3 adenylate cyclase